MSKAAAKVCLVAVATARMRVYRVPQQQSIAVFAQYRSAVARRTCSVSAECSLTDITTQIEGVSPKSTFANMAKRSEVLKVMVEEEDFASCYTRLGIDQPLWEALAGD